jgi:hypothetical protein
MIAETDASVIRRSLRHCVRCCSCTPGASSPIRRSPVCSGSRRRPCARGFIGPGPRLPARWASRMTLSQSKRRQPDEERRRSARRRPVTGRARRLGVPVLIATALAAALLVVAALLPGREAGDTRLGAAPASAKSVLEQVAPVASRAPASAVPSVHQYLYLKWIHGWTNLDGFNGQIFRWSDRDTEQDWEAPNGSGRQPDRGMGISVPHPGRPKRPGGLRGPPGRWSLRLTGPIRAGPTSITATCHRRARLASRPPRLNCCAS